MRSIMGRLRDFTVHHAPFTIGLFLFVGCGPSEQSPVPIDPPRIGIEANEHDFGAIEQGTPVEHTFSVANDGGVPLTIDTVRSGCGCEASTDDDRDVPPGHATQVRVRCDTATSFGAQRRTVSLYSNDPVTPAAAVRLVGTVHAAAVLAPSTFYVGRVHRGERARRDGFVRWPGQQDSLAVMADADAPFRVEVALPAPGSDRGSFTVVMKDDAALGPINAAVHLRNAQGRALRTVRMVGEIVPDVGIDPVRAALATANGAAATAAVLVLNGGPRAVSLTSVKWPPGAAVVETLDPGERYRIVLTAEKHVPEVSEVIVRTDHPEQPLLRVPIDPPAPDTR